MTNKILYLSVGVVLDPIDFHCTDKKSFGTICE